MAYTRKIISIFTLLFFTLFCSSPFYSLQPNSSQIIKNLNENLDDIELNLNILKSNNESLQLQLINAENLSQNLIMSLTELQVKLQASEKELNSCQNTLKNWKIVSIPIIIVEAIAIGGLIYAYFSNN